MINDMIWCKHISMNANVSMSMEGSMGVEARIDSDLENFYEIEV